MTAASAGKRSTLLKREYSAKIANKCGYPSDTTNCTVGAKQPHYWFQAEGNNNPQGTYDPPFYNGAYGFMNGAQTDLFASGSGSIQSPANTSSSSAQASPIAVGASSASVGLQSPTSAADSTVNMQSVSPTTTMNYVSSQVSTASVLQGYQASNLSITSAAASPAITTMTHSTVSSASCQRRKRALNNLSSPDTLRRHQTRQARRFAKRVEHSKDIGRFARAQKEWRNAREKSGLSLRSL